MCAGSGFAILAVALGLASAGEPSPAPGMAGTVAADEIDGVELRLFIPAGVPRLRGVIALPADPEVGTGRTSSNISSWAIDETARNLGFARLGAGLRNNNRGSRGTIIRKALVAGLEGFARSSGHGELATAPLLFAGMSRGGGWSVEAAQGVPARTLAVINVCGGVGDPAKVPTTVPLLALLNGIPDGFKFEERLVTQYAPARAADAVWTAARQWGVGHDWQNADALVLPWLEAAVRLRLPAGADALHPVEASTGWLGDPQTWESPTATIASSAEYTGDRAAAVWLPDRASAHAWRSFQSTEASVQVAVQAGGRDAPASGRRVLVADQGAPVTLGATIAEGTAIATLTWFANDQELATVAAPPWTASWAVPAGAWAVHLRCTRTDGSLAYSRPVTLVGAAVR